MKIVSVNLFLLTLFLTNATLISSSVFSIIVVDIPRPRFASRFFCPLGNTAQTLLAPAYLIQSRQTRRGSREGAGAEASHAVFGGGRGQNLKLRTPLISTTVNV